MSNLTIGRVGIDINIDSISGLSEGGTEIEISGQTAYGSVSDAIVLSQQLSGYVASPDEEFVPVTWADSPDLDGYYRVLDVSIVRPLESAFAGVFRFSCRLERVRGFAAPLFESVIVGAMRQNAHGIVSSSSIAWHGVPLAARGYEGPILTPTALPRSAVDGDMLTIADSGNALYGATPTFYLPPSEWYANAATIRVGGEVVTGRQVPNLPEDWQVDNGLVRVRPIRSQPATLFDIQRLEIGFWNGTTWETQLLQVGEVSGFPEFILPINAVPHTLSVLRNTPEEVGIRLTIDLRGSLPVNTRSIGYLDISVRRGSRFAHMVFKAREARRWGVAVVDGNASVALTGGRNIGVPASRSIMLASATAFGAYASISPPWVSSGIGLATVEQRFDFGAGMTVTFPSAGTLDDLQPLVYQYFAAQVEKVTVAAR